ncbi:CRISPR-associated helicase Cas3' [Saccharopolyspora sp. ID03-671]|uniref:CRISPR-associated helicase Cas3' n=1 Tax=Saccharopolyspora sp. ID03-671 TaxID=3073066 RepID=UPI003244333F
MFEVGVDAPVSGAWGKAGSAVQPHPLVCHAIDTTAVAELLYDVVLGPEVRRELERGLAPLGDVRSWVAVLCGWHDIGKASPIFQAMRTDLAVRYLSRGVRDLVERLHGFSKDPASRTTHGVLTTVHLSQCLKRWGASVEVGDALAFGLGGHHGSMPSAFEVQRARGRRAHRGAASWDDLRTRIMCEVAQLWGLGDPAEAAWDAVSVSVPALVGLAGLTSVSDWIASDTRNFGYADLPLPEDLRPYRDGARRSAAAAVESKLRWRRWAPPADTSYSGLFGEDPRPLQQIVEAVVAGRDEPGVLVIEAPTGEGKTRAGFQAAATLVRRLGLSGMYFALPTRATAAQVHSELEAVAQRLGLDEPPNLVQSLRGLEPSAVDEDGDGARDGHEWFTRKRGLLFPVGVGTIDQALQAAITSRHVFVRLTGLSGKVLVIDEAHDLDAHMRTLMCQLMWWCGRLGIPVVLMSATLPSGSREEFVAHWRTGRLRRKPGEIAARVVGAGGQQVMWAGAEDESEPVPIGLSEVNARRPPVTVHHLEDEKEMTRWLQDRLRERGCGLVIRNLVRDAQHTHDLLKEAFKDWPVKPELVLLTGHTPSRQRREVETRLRNALGPKASDRPHILVVGTQVLQHSLDLDFDLLASDVAPINELIQRVGRVHRHERDPQSRACPVPELGLLQPPEGRNGPQFARGLHTVYPTALLLRTWLALQNRSELKLPAEAPELVHTIYTAPVKLQGRLARRFDTATERLLSQDAAEQSRVSRFYLPPLGSNDSIRELTRYPTLASRTRKDTPWKEDG